MRAVPHQPRPLPSSAIAPSRDKDSPSQSFSLQPLLHGLRSPLVESSSIKTSGKPHYHDIIGTSSHTSSSSVKCLLEGVAVSSKLLSPLTENDVNRHTFLSEDEEREWVKKENIDNERHKKEKIRNEQLCLLNSIENTEAEATTPQHGEDCPFCRSLDCEIM